VRLDHISWMGDVFRLKWLSDCGAGQVTGIVSLNTYSGLLDPVGLVVKAQAGSIFPLGTTVANLAGRHMGASKTQVSGSGNCYAHTRVYKATDHRVWMMPFIREEGCEPF
jgi:hypothetical protein